MPIYVVDRYGAKDDSWIGRALLIRVNRPLAGRAVAVIVSMGDCSGADKGVGRISSMNRGGRTSESVIVSEGHLIRGKRKYYRQHSCEHRNQVLFFQEGPAHGLHRVSQRLCMVIIT